MALGKIFGVGHESLVGNHIHFWKALFVQQQCDKCVSDEHRRGEYLQKVATAYEHSCNLCLSELGSWILPARRGTDGEVGKALITALSYSQTAPG